MEEALRRGREEGARESAELHRDVCMDAWGVCLGGRMRVCMLIGMALNQSVRERSPTNKSEGQRQIRRHTNRNSTSDGDCDCDGDSDAVRNSV